MRTRLGFGVAVLALLAYASGLPAGTASAAPLAPMAALAADGGLAIPAQFRDRDDSSDDERRRRDVSRDQDVNPGDGGKSGGSKKGAKSKGGSGGGGGSGFATGVGIGIGAAIGSAIISGATQCAAQSDRCASRYGNGTSRYRRCMSDGGC